jgi:hypothetical protein
MQAPRAAANVRREQRQLRAWILLCACILFAALEVPFWLGLVYIADDLGAFHLPLRKLYADELAAGRLLIWTSDLYSGFYIAGEGQVGVFHPLHILLYRLLNLRAAFCLEVLLNYPFMLTGTYLFLRERIGRPDAALFGALAFTFTGFNLLHIVHVNAIAVLAHLPWQLWAIDRLFHATGRQQRTWATAAIALLTASQLLLGYPQFVWFSVLTSLIFIGYQVRYESVSRQALAAYAIAMIVALGLGAVQLLPTLDVLRGSVRENLTRDAVLFGSLHPWNVVQLVSPYLFARRVYYLNTHEFTLYVGAVPLLLAVWVIENLSIVRRRPRFVVATLVFGGIMLLLAFGRYGHLYQLQYWLPVVGKFRFASRYAVLFALSVVTLASVAFGELARRCLQDHALGGLRARLPIRFHWTWGLVLISFVMPCAAPLLWDAGHLDLGWHTLVGPVTLLAALALIIAAGRGSRFALYGLVVLTTLDLGTYGLSYAVYRDLEPLGEYAAAASAPPAAPHERVLMEVSSKDRVRRGNQVLLCGQPRADGYAALEPNPERALNTLANLQDASVRWVAQSAEAAAIPGLIPRGKDWFEVPDVRSKARLVPQARGTEAGSIEFVSDEPGRMCLTTTAPNPQELVIAESYHSGWKARLDGNEVTVVREPGDYIGCLVPAGEHRVEFCFRPRSLWWGIRVSLATTVLSAICCAYGLVRRR